MSLSLLVGTTVSNLKVDLKILLYKVKLALMNMPYKLV